MGHIWNYRYDGAGRLTSEADFTGATTHYRHDVMGRVVEVTAPTGLTRRNSYDVLGRLTAVDADSGEYLRYVYDAAGRMTHAETGSGQTASHTLTREYTAAGHLASEAVDGEDPVRHTYDLAGRRVGLATPSGSESQWQWDPAGRLRALSVDQHRIDFTHDLRGAATGWRIGELTISQTHTARGQLASQSATAHSAPALDLGFGPAPASPPTVLREDTYSYRADGNLLRHSIERESSSRSARDYVLDPLGRITDVLERDNAVESYEYDGMGNISAARGAAGEGDRREYRANLLVSDRGASYHYDAAGRLIRKTVTRLSRKPDTWHYGYNAFNQLVEVMTPDRRRWRYTYDALGRRITKGRIVADGVTAETVRFTWDGTQLIEQRGPDGVARWHYRPGGFTPLTQSSSQGEIDTEFFAIVTDLVGTPVELVEPDSGNVAGSATMDVWGSASWAGASTALRFPGQYHDAESGLHYNLHRYYDPATARYVTQDPLGLAPAANPSTYPHNPTGWSDPLGLVPRACDAVTHYGPHTDPGPLEQDKRETFRSETYTEVVTSEEVILHRVWGGGANELGGFWTRDLPGGPLQAQLDSALNPEWGNTAESVVSIRAPAATAFYEGTAASQDLLGGGSLLGGGNQVFIDLMIPRDWIIP